MSFSYLMCSAVPYKEKPHYNSKRRTAVPRVFNAAVTPPGNGIQWTRRRSISNPHLNARDLDSVSVTSAQSGNERVNKLQRPYTYDSDSPFVDSASGGNLHLVYSTVQDR